MSPRIISDAAEASYHVITRTAQCEFWLEQHGFRDIMENLLKALSTIYYVDVLSHATLSNHYHIVLTIRKPDFDPKDIEQRFEQLQSLNARKKRWKESMLEEYYERFTNLSMFMWDLNKRAANRINKIRKTKGHFWGGRYKSILIEDDKQMAQTMSYIDQNPVRAGLVEKPGDYPYCTSGQIKKELEQGINRPMPAVGFLKYLPPEKRARAWMENQNALALHKKAQRKKADNQRKQLKVKGFR